MAKRRVEHHHHWYYWGGGFLALGVAFLAVPPAVAPNGKVVAETISSWHYIAAFCCFALAIFCGFAGARGWRFPFARVSEPARPDSKPDLRTPLQRQLGTVATQALDAIGTLHDCDARRDHLIERGEGLLPRAPERGFMAWLNGAISAHNFSTLSRLWLGDVAAYVDECHPGEAGRVVSDVDQALAFLRELRVRDTAVSVSDHVATVYAPGPTSPHVRRVDFETDNREAALIHTGVRPRVLRFFAPIEGDVRERDLPADFVLPDGGLLSVERFLDDGFSVRELNTDGLRILADVYDEPGAGPVQEIVGHLTRAIDAMTKSQAGGRTASDRLADGQRLLRDLTSAGFDNIEDLKRESYQWLQDTHDFLRSTSGAAVAGFFVGIPIHEPGGSQVGLLGPRGRAVYMADHRDSVVERFKGHLDRLYSLVRDGKV